MPSLIGFFKNNGFDQRVRRADGQSFRRFRSIPCGSSPRLKRPMVEVNRVGRISVKLEMRPATVVEVEVPDQCLLRVTDSLVALRPKPDKVRTVELAALVGVHDL